MFFITFAPRGNLFALSDAYCIIDFTALYPAEERPYVTTRETIIMHEKPSKYVCKYAIKMRKICLIICPLKFIKIPRNGFFYSKSSSLKLQYKITCCFRFSNKNFLRRSEKINLYAEKDLSTSHEVTGQYLK